MRSNCALYVDAGYLLAAAATRVTGTSLRGSVVISYPDLVQRLIEQAEEPSGLPLLRVNWYDSGNRPGGAPDATQETVGMLPRVKLRLGRTSPHGEQKGVDLRIGLDLAAHGRNHVVDTMYLVSETTTSPKRWRRPRTTVPRSSSSPCPTRPAVHTPSRTTSSASPMASSSWTRRPSTRRCVRDSSSRMPSPSCRRRQLAWSSPFQALVPRRGSPPRLQRGKHQEAAPSHEAVPTPAILARSRPQPVGTGTGAAGTTTGSKVAWSSSREHPVNRPHTLSPAMIEMIDDVCRGVVTAWRATATDEDRRRVLSERPFIPSDLDRTLLTDLSARLDVYDIPDELRYRLREQFWDAMDELGR